MDSFTPISGINSQISPVQALTAQKSNGAASGISEGDNKYTFSNIMASQLQTASNVMNDSADMTSKLIAGEVKNPHDVAIAGQKANIMLKLTTTICSKVSSACTTLFQMQI